MRSRAGQRHRPTEVEVAGGALRVGVWDAAADAPTVVAVHGVTASHLAWAWLAEALPDVRIVAPDLRGRGRSNDLTGGGGMADHADDLARVCEAMGIGPALVVGHSMGAFVTVVLAHRRPDLVTGILLVDGGLPLQAPAGLAPEQLVAAVLGPTAERLSMRFTDTDAYLRFWAGHPAFADGLTPALVDYFAYDLVEDGDAMRPATSLEATTSDTIDLQNGSAVPAAWQALDARTGERIPAHLITVGRGLRDEVPGLYPPSHLGALLAQYPWLPHERWDDLNHYTVIMSPDGAESVAARVRAMLG